MNDSLILQAALLTGIASVFLNVAGAELKKQGFIDWGKLSTHLTLVFITLASLRLFYLLITHDFQNVYVASYTSRDLPLFYRISAFWAGQEGSLLLWVWLISILSSVVILGEKPGNDGQFMAYASGMLGAITVGFLYIIVTSSNPFKRLDFIPLDGNGLNPLLQDPGMILHPPVLFLGYAGMAVPFAFAIAGVIMRREWIRDARRWLIFAWAALSMGNIIGAWWAFHVLGWGGYWGWDPVENSSLLPWLTASALLHSVMVEEREGRMRAWNFILITVTFLLVLYGTFLTRSGILQSVHAFANSGLGGILISFLILIMAASLRLFIRRWDYLRGDPVRIELSRPGLILLTAILLLVSGGTIIIGSFYPLLLELIHGYQQMVQPGYYNTLNVPVALALLLLLGLCPYIRWRRYTFDELKGKIMIPALASITAVILGFLTGVRDPIGVSSILVCTLAFTTHLREFYEASGSGDGKSLSNLWHAIERDHRRFGGYIVHIALIVMVIGVAGSSLYEKRDTFTIQPGSAHEIEDYTIKYLGTEPIQRENGIYYCAIVDIYKNGRFIDRGVPNLFYSFRFDETYQHVYIHSTLPEDLYIIYQGFEKGYALFEVRVIPLVSLIWWGGILLLIGAIVAMIPDKRRDDNAS
ncbi:MAG TPA: heme lyase CcmF/NrfE family subunit [Candidatus Syntrophoarchaeum butanivorans]|uniref:Cytochrome c-type biogenesis protein CcmF n=1 Tax=Candidatus Syntropharchaeum butanivorans TaxID=1839936 RepID=A0A1F2P5Z5_9EURY|nr:MAG: cytochrome c-type biogenesis protein CcmF [Candidatus Syntrophoarchaeum butanivorans]HEC57165.1 heme lyase CcmF/NrfE family subunit [Candidatus Syntrophoarchaeum butanivorans]